MSPLKPDRLHVSLELDRIALVKTQGLFQVHIAADKCLPAAFDPERPQAWLSPLKAELANRAWQAGTASVVLSDRLVHYVTLEVQPGIRSVDELKLVIAAQFEEVFGLPAADWEIAADLDPFAQRLLACAVDRRLLAELESIFRAAGLRLASVQPFLLREYNRWRRRLPRDLAWFAAQERHSVTLALRSCRRWHGLRTHSLDGEGAARLPGLLARDQVAYGMARVPKQVWLAGDATAESLAAASGLTLVRLDRPDWPGRTGQWCRDYRLALAGCWQ